MDPARLPHAPNALALARQESDDLHEIEGRMRMKIIAGLLIAAALAFVSGCAKTDWIDRTLVTVDVTGVWQGRFTRTSGAGSGDVVFVLQQRGPKVAGEMKFPPGSYTVQIEGTVSGDTFTFHETRGPTTTGEFQVNGDEMIGSWARLTVQRATLRRQQ